MDNSPKNKPAICPKKDCGREEVASRYKAGDKYLICGNGHSWSPEQELKDKMKKMDEIFNETPSFGFSGFNPSTGQIPCDPKKRNNMPLVRNLFGFEVIASAEVGENEIIMVLHDGKTGRYTAGRFKITTEK